MSRDDQAGLRPGPERNGPVFEQLIAEVRGGVDIAGDEGRAGTPDLRLVAVWVGGRGVCCWAGGRRWCLQGVSFGGRLAVGGYALAGVVDEGVH